MSDSPPSKTQDDEKKSRYSSMTKSELEAFAIAAISEHRRLMAADEVVYEEWSRANDDPATSRAILKNLQDEYMARQKRSEAQQDELSKIIDALGFVPVVPADDELE